VTGAVTDVAVVVTCDDEEVDACVVAVAAVVRTVWAPAWHAASGRTATPARITVAIRERLA
ncbi:hypothetical protein, partial [Frankia sp. Cr1]|uniref:hypothetical protein n=1 Tax=Frankia sp. Cr1 TaxID=3073931 RepID=UPI002AD406FD